MTADGNAMAMPVRRLSGPSTNCRIVCMNRRRFLVSSVALLSASGLGAAWWLRRWRYIVIHHSAGNYGTIEFLQQVHRERQASDPIDAIPYHYVIGNGNGLAMGEVASDWRNEYNLWGAHVSRNNRDRNIRGIGICLIGNYDVNPVPDAQYTALLRLTKQLMWRYDINTDSINGHGLIAGESTRCPGQHFPMARFLRDLG